MYPTSTIQRFSINAPILLLVVSQVAEAAPIINTISSAITDGSIITISGTGFGPKSTAAPYRWDNFESGTVAADLSGWLLDSSGGAKPQYSNLRSHSGTKSGLAQFIGVGNYNCV